MFTVPVNICIVSYNFTTPDTGSACCMYHLNAGIGVLGFKSEQDTFLHSKFPDGYSIYPTIDWSDFNLIG